MFDIGWTEMLVIAVVMIVVVGPKDLPKMLRTFGRTTAKLRSMAGDFQKQFNEALKEAELDDVKKSVETLRSMNPANEIKKSLNPFEKAAADVRAGLQSLQNPAPNPAEPEPSAAVPTEPLKNGATAMPGAEPLTTPAAPAPTAPAAAATTQPVEPASVPPASTTSVNGTTPATNAVGAVPETPREATPVKVRARKTTTSTAVDKSGTAAAGTKASVKAGPKAPPKTRKTAGSAT